jgi:RNA polymerase sigma-70 factor, ECF subfamily
MSAMADSALVPADPGDFETATLPYLGAVARFALSLTRNRAEADDLVQETYLRALRGWHTFRPGSDARRWLFTICRNTFVQFRRRRRDLVESDDGDLDAMPAILSHVQAVHDGLGELFDQLDVGPAIERAIGELPEPHHTVLVLVDLEGYSYDEAAAVLGVPVGTVRSRLFRARRMIQEALIAYAEDAGLARRPAPEARELREVATDRAAS